jgi:DNA-binding NarL/FixJ family response regulator
MRIFLVEDSEQIRERLVELIQAVGGHTVVGEADNFDDAVSGIRHSRPDVAIFDIKLARGNGIDALARAKKEMPTLRGIVLSNYATPQHVRASAEAGAEYFLDKSAEFEKIGDILAAMQAA